MELYKLLTEVLITESVSVIDVNKAIDNHNRIIINYNTRGEDIATGSRVIEVYAYGLTKAGNPVIRAFQPYGDTSSRVPSWKFFRLDRISEWKPTKQTFSKPASEYYKGLGMFNPNGDNTMSVVYKIAKFGDDIFDISSEGPKLKDKIFKTDTENKLERLRQQVTNPIKISDLKSKVISNVDTDKDDTGPKLKTDKEPSYDYKKEAEDILQPLKKQLENPRKIDLNTLKDVNDTNNKEEELTTIKDLKDKYSNGYKKEAEDILQPLKKQLENPRKIDLSKMPKR